MSIIETGFRTANIIIGVIIIGVDTHMFAIKCGQVHA